MEPETETISKIKLSSFDNNDKDVVIKKKEKKEDEHVVDDKKNQLLLGLDMVMMMMIAIKKIIFLSTSLLPNTVGSSKSYSHLDSPSNGADLLVINVIVTMKIFGGLKRWRRSYVCVCVSLAIQRMYK